MPGETGIWMFIFGDMLVFSMFFSVYLYYRAQSPAIFITSQAHLNQSLGMLNTALMLSSSWCVATAVRAARRGMRRATPLLFMFGFGCGTSFVIVKYFEYSQKIQAGFTLNTNDFFIFYYMLTGIHLMHVLIGMGVLLFMARYALKAREFDAITLRNLESGASFWHVVDLLWIVLFALLYLVR